MQTIFYFIAGVASVGMGLLRSNTALLMVLSVAGRMAVMCASVSVSLILAASSLLLGTD